MPADAAWAELIAAAALGGTAFQGPSTYYLELVSNAPTATVRGTPVVYSGYAGPVAVPAADWTGDSAGGRVTSADVSFGNPVPGTTDVAIYVEAYDSAAKTNRLWYEQLDAPLTCDTSLDSVVFPAGQLHMVFGQ